MKKLITTLTLSIAALVSFSQSQNWWRTNGNTPASADVFGTTNAQPINIVTNNVLKMVLDANGNLRLVNFAGTGTRLVTTDVNGNSCTTTRHYRAVFKQQRHLAKLTC